MHQNTKGNSVLLANRLVYIACEVRISCKGHLAPFCMFFSYPENQFYAFSNSTVFVYILMSVLKTSQDLCH